MTWFRNLNVPETIGLLKNQVTAFSIETCEGKQLYAWHILPVEMYHEHELPLTTEPMGCVSDIMTRLTFQLLGEDPEPQLVIYMYGAAETVGS